ncbi:MAG: fatty acid desaturase family protein [Deltaproteobacteria bacterium]|nr:fatty acid desaturase family protein [Deltaproteobacteria bacterium]
MKIADVATQEELGPFTERSNWKAIGYVTFNWACVAAIFLGVAVWTNPFTILAGIALLGGRQLGFAALMHDCGHGMLFRGRRANALIGQWLCAYPILSDLPRYAAGHQKHHALAGTREDPDLPNYRAYPISKESFRRKIVRDLTGQTGWKALRATWRRGRRELKKAPWHGNALAGHAIVNGALFAVLFASGEGLLFAMWPAAYLTSYMLSARLRQVAEHGAVPDLYDLDPRKNTRTTLVRWWEKPFVAPFHLNYHLEHHFQANVPCYHLPAFHRFLESKGIYEETEFPNGYPELYAKTVPA